MRRRVASAVATAMMISTPAPVRAEEGCQSKRCHQRVVKRHKRMMIRPYRGWLAKVRRCESGGDYRAVSSSGTYMGSYQFNLAAWQLVGGHGWPHHATRLEQDYRAVRLLHVQGRGAWPVCG